MSTVGPTFLQFKSVVELLHASSGFASITNTFVYSVGDTLPKYQLKFSEPERVTNSVLIRYKGHYAYLNNVVSPLGTGIHMHCLHSFPLRFDDPDFLYTLSYFFPKRDTLCVTHLSTSNMDTCDKDGMLSSLLAYYGQVIISRQPRLDVLYDPATLKLLLHSLKNNTNSSLVLEHDPSTGPFFICNDDLGIGFNAEQGPVHWKDIPFTPIDIDKSVFVDLASTFDLSDWTPMYKGQVHPSLRIEHQPLVLSDDESSSEDESEKSESKPSPKLQTAQQNALTGRGADRAVASPWPRSAFLQQLRVLQKTGPAMWLSMD